MGKKVKNDVMKIKLDYSKVPNYVDKGDYENHMTNIKWGTGVQRPKKGKGSYKRNQKHKVQSYKYEDGLFLFPFTSVGIFI